jgi:hypothetical protein
MTDSAPTSEPRRPSAVMIVVTIIGFVGPALGLAYAYKSCLGATVRGSVALRSRDLDWRQRLGACAADAMTDAVTLDGGGESLVRASVDAVDGPRVEISGPAPWSTLRLTPTNCAGMHVRLKRVGTRSDGGPIFDGSMVASCDVGADGTRAAVHVELDGWWRACSRSDER